MKITFDLTVYEAQQVLRSCTMGHMCSLVTSAYPAANLSPIIDDLSKVVTEMMDRDSSIGQTGPPLHPRTKKVYLDE